MRMVIVGFKDDFPENIQRFGGVTMTYWKESSKIEQDQFSLPHLLCKRV